MNNHDIARLCHEVNRAYCAALGDDSQLPWEAAPEWQRTSAVKGVDFIIGNPDALPSASHESWLMEKQSQGWVYGPVKDAEKKEHPCFVPYDELPVEQRAKDHLFGAIVRTCIAIDGDALGDGLVGDRNG
jgi:RyR domain